MSQTGHFDIIIAGAGPAGCACALALKDSGLRIALVDRHTFPRDKVCGDTIPGRAISILRGIDPGFSNAFGTFPTKNLIRKSVLFRGNRYFSHNWVLDAYTCKRAEFDNFLLTRVRQHVKAEILEDAKVIAANREKGSWHLECQNGQCISSEMLVVADGANGKVSRILSGVLPDSSRHIMAVRAYFRGVRYVKADCTEFYIDDRFLPGYFWLFPLPGGVYNAGLGMVSADVVRKGISLKKAFHEITEGSPVLREKFRDASPVTDLSGYGIPLRSQKIPLSGEGFVLTGDAAGLADPLGGDGIGNAVLSGKEAALQAIRCFRTGDYSSEFMKSYDRAINHFPGRELRKNTLLRDALTSLSFLGKYAFLAGKKISSL